jgi:pimeloyl-ACP methyl ester carboxylesterase
MNRELHSEIETFPYAQSDDPSWRDLDWDTQLRDVEVAGADVRYVDLGEGSPLLLLHGISGCWQHWVQNIPRLARDHRVIALDLPGFASSPLPGVPLTIEHYAKVIDEFCELLELGPVTLVGNSLGGLISIKTAAHYPERVARLIAVDAAGISTARLTYGAGIGLQLLLVQSQQYVKLLAKLRGTEGEHPLSLAVEHPEAFERGLLRTVFSPGIRSRGFRPVARHLTELALRGGRFRTPASVRCPTLVVWGRQDRLLPVADAEVLHEMIEGSELVILDDTGHMPQLERPREFNRLVLDFAC